MQAGALGYFTLPVTQPPTPVGISFDTEEYLQCFEAASLSGRFMLYQCTVLTDGSIIGVVPVCRVAYPMKVSLSEADMSAYSVDVTSKGTQPKWQKSGYWIKEDLLGYEGLAEDLVSRFAEYIPNIDVIPYYSTRIERPYGTICVGCKSLDFIPAGHEYRTLFQVLGEEEQQLPESALAGIKHTIGTVLEKAGIDITQYLAKNIYLDAITLNEDRHLRNLGLLYNGSYHEAPIFDNGLSCLSDEKAYSAVSVPEGVKLVRSKPFGRRFEKQVAAMQEVTDFKLQIDTSGIYDLLAHYTNPFYSGEQVRRACTVLKNRLAYWEGKIWEAL